MNKLYARLQRYGLPRLIALLCVVLCVGVVLAALIINDGYWMDWSFSSLGEVQAPSAPVFNISLFIASLLLWCIGDVFIDNFKKLHSVSAAKLSGYSFKLLAICFLGIALFPNDTQHAMHLVFARGMIIVFAAYIILLPIAMPQLPRRVKLVSYSVIPLAALLTFQGFFAKSIPFVLFEILLGALTLGWIYFLGRSVTQHAKRASTPPTQTVQHSNSEVTS